MIIVSNTSPLTNLAAVGQFSLFKQLYGDLHIADAVWDELNAAGEAWPGRNEVANSSWVYRHTVQNQLLITSLRQDLDRGESETIVLALELGAELTLIDEKAGRQLATRFGLVIGGVLGLLIEAKQKGYLEQIRPIMDDLRRDANFHISNSLYNKALKLSGE